MLKIFKENVFILPQPKPLWQYQWSNMIMTKLPIVVFCWFQRNKDDITIVAQHVRDLFTIAAERPSQRRDWNASAIWNREFSNAKLDIFPKMYGIPDRHLRNNALKHPKITQDGMLNMSSWYKIEADFNCSKTLEDRNISVTRLTLHSCRQGYWGRVPSTIIELTPELATFTTMQFISSA